MKILLITHFFPPLNTMASQRTFAFARFMAELGHFVIVLTTDKNVLNTTSDLSLSWKLDKIKIFETQPLPTFMSEIFAFLRRSSTSTNFGWYSKVALREVVLGKSIDGFEYWVLTAFPKALELFRKYTFDVIISSYGPAAAHYLSFLLKTIFPKCIWVADYRDLWSHCHIAPGLFPLNVVSQFLERFVIKKADIITTVSYKLKEQLVKLYRKPTYVIENGFFPEDEITISSNTKGLSLGKVVFSYTGYLYHKKRDPKLFFEAIKELITDGQLDPSKIELRFYGPNSFILMPEIEQFGLQKIAFCFRKVSRRDSLEIQKKSQGLLFLEWFDQKAAGVVTGKLFEYLISGVPIIGVGVHPASAAGQLILNANAGFVCGNDKNIIKEAILKIINGYKINPNIEFIRQFRRDKLVEKMVRVIEQFRQKTS